MADNPCTSASGKPKKRWATQAAAEFVAAENLRMGRRSTSWYKCPGCERWHTTSPRESKRARAKKKAQIAGSVQQAA